MAARYTTRLAYSNMSIYGVLVVSATVAGTEAKDGWDFKSVRV